MTTLKAGDKAPDFSVEDQDGKLHTLEDYKGKKLVIFFYPKASTPGCTAQACNLRDNYEVLQNKGYEILGASADTKRRQTNFKNKNELPFPLLADESKEMLNAYGVWGLNKNFVREYEGHYRTTFLIDEEGIIEEVITKVKTKDHTSQIL